MKEKTRDVLWDILFMIEVIMMIYLFLDFSCQYIFEITFVEYVKGLFL